MVQHKPTPEEQLLKLIENPDAKKGAADPSKAAALTKTKTALRLPDLGKIFRRKQKSAPAARPFIFEVRRVNQSLFALVAASLIYLLFDLLVFKPGRADFLAHVSVADAVYPLRSSPQKAVSPGLSYYKETVARRNPFLPHTAAPPPAAGGEPVVSLPSAPGSKMSQLLTALKLVGISWGEEPLAMVEDASTGRTYFLRRGQEINGIKVQAISQEKVTFTYEGEEGELF